MIFTEDGDQRSFLRLPEKLFLVGYDHVVTLSLQEDHVDLHLGPNRFHRLHCFVA